MARRIKEVPDLVGILEQAVHKTGAAPHIKEIAENWAGQYSPSEIVKALDPLRLRQEAQACDEAAERIRFDLNRRTGKYLNDEEQRKLDDEYLFQINVTDSIRSAAANMQRRYRRRDFSGKGGALNPTPHSVKSATRDSVREVIKSFEAREKLLRSQGFNGRAGWIQRVVSDLKIEVRSVSSKYRFRLGRHNAWNFTNEIESSLRSVANRHDRAKEIWESLNQETERQADKRAASLERKARALRHGADAAVKVYLRVFDDFTVDPGPHDSRELLQLIHDRIETITAQNPAFAAHRITQPSL